MKTALPKLFFGFSGLSACMVIVKLSMKLGLLSTAAPSTEATTPLLDVAPAFEMMIGANDGTTICDAVTLDIDCSNNAANTIDVDIFTTNANFPFPADLTANGCPSSGAGFQTAWVTFTLPTGPTADTEWRREVMGNRTAHWALYRAATVGDCNSALTFVACGEQTMGPWDDFPDNNITGLETTYFLAVYSPTNLTSNIEDLNIKLRKCDPGAPPCVASAGTLSSDVSSICPGGSVDLSITGAVSVNGYVPAILIYNAAGNLVSFTNSFNIDSQEAFFTTAAPDTYCIYALHILAEPSVGCFNANGVFGLTITFAGLQNCLSQSSCFDLSLPLCITVNPLPAGTLGGDEVCLGDNAFLTFTATAGTPPFSIVIDGLFNNNPINAGQGNGNPVWTFINPPVGSTNYKLLSITDANGCVLTDNPIDSARIVVTPLPAGTLGGDEVCLGDDAFLTFTATAGTPPFSIVIDGLFNNNPINAGQGNGNPVWTFINPPVGSTNYKLLSITDANGCVLIGNPIDSADIVVNPLPTGNLLLAPTAICEGGEAFLSFAGSGPFPMKIAVKPLNSGQSIVVDIDSMTFWTLTDQFYQLGINNYILESIEDANGCVRITNDTVKLNVFRNPQIDLDIENAEICETEILEIKSTASGGVSDTCLQIQWQFIPSNAMQNAAFTSIFYDYQSAKDLVINDNNFPAADTSGGKFYVKLGPDPGWKIRAVLRCDATGCNDAVDSATVRINKLIETIIAENETYTIPNCANSVTVCYSFNILSGCAFDQFDPDKLQVNFGGLQSNLVSTSPTSVQPTGDNGIFIEYCLQISPEDVGLYSVNIDYDDTNIAPVQDVTVQIQILAREATTDYRNLSCNAEVNVRLDENCEVELKASQ
ncbi:MAG TPA: hypothetical protein PKC76_18025, partial [Saprospiraceae bacterium]|nr:hypothetical protein [Saprospiraceae bacterium]HMP26032.1 hypothetical protein [Saprospiraceae bacterium]